MSTFTPMHGSKIFLFIQEAPKEYLSAEIDYVYHHPNTKEQVTPTQGSQQQLLPTKAA